MSAEQAPVVPVMAAPTRPAFGPRISVVSVDAQGRLWLRMSAALVIAVIGLVLVAVPLGALWFSGSSLADSGQVHFEPDTSRSGDDRPPTP